MMERAFHDTRRQPAVAPGSGRFDQIMEGHDAPMSMPFVLRRGDSRIAQTDRPQVDILEE